MENENSRIELSNLSEEIVSENDLPCLLENYESQALKHIELFDYVNASQQLKRIEEIMESISAQGGLISIEYIISTLNNLSFCSQELNDSQKTFKYLDACFFNTQSLDFMKNSAQNTEISIKKYKYIAKSALQLTNLLISSKDQRKSLKVIEIGYNFSCKALTETLKSCRKLHKNYSVLPKSPNYSKGKMNKILLVERALPILEAINLFVMNGVTKKIKMRSALGIKTFPDWIYNFSVESLQKIIPTRSSEFTFTIGIQSELTKDSILYKIILMCASLIYFSICLRENGEIKEASKYLNQAKKLAQAFLPKKSQIIGKILGEEKEIERIEKENKEKGKLGKIRRNFSVNLQYNEKENGGGKGKSAYDRQNSEIFKILGKKNTKKHRSDSLSLFKDIHNSISFVKQSNEYE